MFGFQHLLLTWLGTGIGSYLEMEVSDGGKFVEMETGERIHLEGEASQPANSVTYGGVALTYADEFVTYGA